MTFDLIRVVQQLDTDWKYDEEFLKICNNHAESINTALNEEYQKFKDVLQIYPEQTDILNAFNAFNMNDLKVVIVGQDCYIRGEANGLCFSVKRGFKTPPSLKNIFKEIHNEYGVERTNTDLSDIAEQGVLLINRALTVREGASLSHMKIWKQFTEDILNFICNRFSNIVYILWGRNAQEIIPLINSDCNEVLCSVHPSPLAQTRGNSFVGNMHFKKCNEYLEKHNRLPITWV
jgi:uracil-DNA glycosylase